MNPSLLVVSRAATLFWLLLLLMRFGFILSLSQRLSQTYSEIKQRANQLEEWPDSKNFCDECLVLGKNGIYNLPRFTDGHGTVGVFGFLHDNLKARSILAECDAVFGQFCQQICENCNSEVTKNPSILKDWILRSPSTSHHITVAILQEHPSFLRDSDDLNNWRPLSDDFLQRLSKTLQEKHEQLPHKPQLQLDSLLWTPDGAMIAGFVDTTTSLCFDQLRQSCQEIAQQEMGDLLTSRPKNLIHATIGRIIGLPPEASQDDRKTLTELCKQYNKEVLPKTVESIRNNNHDHHDGSFALKEISLARNTVWMLKEYIEYGRWSVSF